MVLKGKQINFHELKPGDIIYYEYGGTIERGKFAKIIEGQIDIWTGKRIIQVWAHWGIDPYYREAYISSEHVFIKMKRNLPDWF